MPPFVQAVLMLMQSRLPSDLADWLADSADSLSASPVLARQLLLRLAGAQVFHVGVPARDGGRGGDLVDAMAVVAAVARHSLAAAVVACAQREVVELLLASANVAVREHRLPSLLDGSMAGVGTLVAPPPGPADGAGRTVAGTDTGRGWRLHGRLSPVPNVEPHACLLAVPVHFGRQAGQHAVVLISGDEDGLNGVAVEAPEGLRATCSTAFELAGVYFREDESLGDDGEALGAKLRRAASLLRCGLPTGVARAALDAAEKAAAAPGAAVYEARVRALRRALEDALDAIVSGWRDGLLREDASALDGLRSYLARLACEAVAVERLAAGNEPPQAGDPTGRARRQREAGLLAGS